MFSVEIVSGPEYTRDDDGWEHHAYQIRCRYGRRSFVSPWRQGVGITGDPEARSVLDCMLSDASSADQDFETWAADYGMDTDSRRAYATWEQVRKQTAQLRRIFGDDWDLLVVPAMDSSDPETVSRRFAAAA